MAPGDTGRGEHVDRVAQPVFKREETVGIIRIALAGHPLVERNDIAAGAKGLVAAGVDENRGYLGIRIPGRVPLVQRLKHIQRQGVERTCIVERYMADALAIGAYDLIEDNG